MVQNQSDIIDAFIVEIYERGFRHDWVAQKIGISKTTLSNIFAERDTLSEENRQKINTLLGTTFGDSNL